MPGEELVPDKELAADTASQPAIDVRALWAGYGSHIALRDVSFQVAPQQLTGLVGPNGSGKSTLLRCLLGLHKPWRGEDLLFGEPVRKARRRLGYMPQSDLVDWAFPVTAADVVLMGRYGRIGLLRRPGRHDREIAMQALEQVRMADRSTRRIGELSGGEQRRVLIARALAQEAEVLLLDEPFAGLDAAAEHDLLNLFQELKAEGKTLLVATHDLSCVAGSFDSAVFLNRSVVAWGPLSEVFTEEVLSKTFERHLVMLNMRGRLYATHH